MLSHQQEALPLIQANMWTTFLLAGFRRSFNQTARGPRLECTADSSKILRLYPKFINHAGKQTIGKCVS